MIKTTLVPLKNLRTECEKMERYRIPMVLLISRSDCTFCREVRINYLSPIARTVDENKLCVRELESDTVATIVNQDGKTVRVSEWLTYMKVRFFPTVLFLGSDLKQLVEPLLGLNQSGFYSAYLDQRIQVALESESRHRDRKGN